MKLTLNDGTEFDNSSLIRSGDNLFLYIHGEYSMKDVFDAFYDKKQTIIFDNGVEQIEYSGFDILIAVRQEAADFVSAVLKKE